MFGARARQGRNGAVSVIALAERGALFDPGPCMCATACRKLAQVPPVSFTRPKLMTQQQSGKRTPMHFCLLLRVCHAQRGPKV